MGLRGRIERIAQPLDLAGDQILRGAAGALGKVFALRGPVGIETIDQRDKCERETFMRREIRLKTRAHCRRSGGLEVGQAGANP